MASNKCTRCHRRLTDEFSIAIGLGPECRGRMIKRGWRMPRGKWEVRNGRTVLVGVIGKMEPPKAEGEKQKVKHGNSNQPKS